MIMYMGLCRISPIIIQHTVPLPKYVLLNVRRPTATDILRYTQFSCVGEENGKIKIVSSFSGNKLCLVINALNNKTIILLDIVGYPLVFIANSSYSLVAEVSGDNLCNFTG